MSKTMNARHNELKRLRESCKRKKDMSELYEVTESMFSDDKNLELFSIRRLFESLVDDGYELVQNHFGGTFAGARFLEASSTIDTSAFANIIGQYSYTKILSGYNQPKFVGDQLVEIINSDLSGEKIPGVTRVGDAMEIVNEGQAYPNATFGEEWIDTPATTKRGLILNVTREAIFFDRTALVLSRAKSIGEDLQVNREKRILDCVCGITTTYRRNGAAAVATYGDTTGEDNLSASTPLVDWTSINTVEQLFVNMSDPNTGEAIAVEPDTLLVPKGLENTAKRIRNAMEVRATSASAVNTTLTGGNSIDRNLNIVSGPYVDRRVGNSTTWFYGKPKEAFGYIQNWPLQTVMAPENSELDFTSDIVTRVKATERGTPVVMEKRKMAKATA